MIDPIANLFATIVVLVLAYMLFVKGPFVRLWWPLVAPIAHPLGFRCVVMDMSFGIHSIQWRTEWMHYPFSREVSE